MKLIIAFLVCINCLAGCHAQQSFGTAYLELVKTIEMPGVSGRIDHMAVNPKEQVLYVAALGNNTVEVIDLEKGLVIRSIKGIEEPQGIAWLPEQNEIAVASGANGDCIFFNASTFKIVATVHLGGDADNIRYDATERKIYVGYGNGAIALIDPVTHKQAGNLKLHAHPESFQLDKKNNKLYVNLPDDHSISIIDLKTFNIVDTWRISGLSANFPMTLDTAHDQIFVGYRHPAVLACYNSLTGKEINKINLVGDVDDIFYYPDKQAIVASGGDGYINIFEKGPGNTFKLVSNIRTRQGARTSFLIPSLGYYILAERAEAGKTAAIVVYKIHGSNK